MFRPIASNWFKAVAFVSLSWKNLNKKKKNCEIPCMKCVYGKALILTLMYFENQFYDSYLKSMRYKVDYKTKLLILYLLFSVRIFWLNFLRK